MSIEKINQGDQLSQSADLVNDNIDKLKMLFPEIVTEGRIDFKVLQQVLGEELEEEEEYYRFTWAGKSQARREAHKPSTGTLRPAKEESLDWDTTENMYIEGDNLEVLKLMQKSYAGKIKMIYIDPPYNTGKDFVYKDNYKDNLKNYQEVTGQIDSDGNKFSTNSDSDGRYHSNWLNMMYPRLRLARNLLTDDGLIFISIDDNEVDNLKKIVNEIFGEENNLNGFVWYYEGVNDNQDEIKKTHEYIIAACKNVKKFETNSKARDINVQLNDIINNSIVKNGDANPPSVIKLPIGFPCEIENGIIKASSINSLSYNNDIVIDNFKLINELEVTSGWSSKEILLEYIKNNFNQVKDSKNQLTNFVIKGNGNIHYLKKRDQSYIISVLRNYGTTQNASNLLTELGLKKYFSFPKPVDLIKFLFKIQANYKDGLFLDFFSGSATSAEALMKLNIEDNGNRKFIAIQLPEATAVNSDSFQDGYKNICEIGKERIRRVVKRIKEENPEKSKDMDLGFKVFKLDGSNIKSWDGNPENLNESLFDAVGNIKTDRTEEDVLYEILLKYGLDLTLPIEERIIEGKKVFNVGLGSLFICLSDNITAKVAEGIGQWKEACSPEICRVIFKDNGFTDVEKTNSVQTLKRYGINEIRSI